MIIHLIDQVNKLSSRVLSRVIRIQTVNIREQQQQICMGQCRNNRRKRIIVSELDFISRYSIIFIYNRDRTELDQLIKGIRCISSA